uniref:Uncharacterized protein n=1 Tax=Ixodes ricinus TaxID=34613 RepID=A0A6B0UV39_IXORI
MSNMILIDVSRPDIDNYNGTNHGVLIVFRTLFIATGNFFYISCLAAFKFVPRSNVTVLIDIWESIVPHNNALSPTIEVHTMCNHVNKPHAPFSHAEKAAHISPWSQNVCALKESSSSWGTFQCFELAIADARRTCVKMNRSVQFL